MYNDTSANEDNSFRITFVSRNMMLSGVSLLAVSNVNNPVGLAVLPCVMRSAHFFVTHIQTEQISSWNGPTAHICCFTLARASTKTFVSRIHIRKLSPKNSEKIVSRKIRQQGHSLAEVSLYLQNVTKTIQSACTNNKLHNSNKLSEINDIDTPSLSVQKSNHSTLEIRA